MLLMCRSVISLLPSLPLSLKNILLPAKCVTDHCRGTIFCLHQVHFIQYLSWCLVETAGRKTTEVKPHCTRVVLACGDTHVRWTFGFPLTPTLNTNLTSRDFLGWRKLCLTLCRRSLNQSKFLLQLFSWWWGPIMSIFSERPTFDIIFQINRN